MKAVSGMTQMRPTAAKTLPPIHPNLGIEAALRRSLQKTIKEMDRSVKYWLSAAYKANEPAIIVQDELPATALRRIVRRLAKQWQTNFDKGAEDLAAYFAQSVSSRSDDQLKQILRRAGFAVDFKMTRAQRDVLQATISENVALIKSIPQQYFTAIEGEVMRSVTAGRDLAPLTKFLQEQYGKTHRRAGFIARDQVNKATASLTRARQIEIGITEAIWVHSSGGRKPRPTHVAAGARQQRYDVTKGWFDPHVQKLILPGELPNCRCVSRSVVLGFD